MYPKESRDAGFTGYPRRKEPHWTVTGWALLAGIVIIACAAAVYVNLMPH